MARLEISGTVCETDGFFDGLMDGSIDPYDLLDDGADEVVEAIELLREFHDLMEENDLIELY